MPRKMSRNALCGFCGRTTNDAALGDYVELEVTIPDALGRQRQLLGAHVRCMNVALVGVEIEVDALVDDPTTWS